MKINLSVIIPVYEAQKTVVRTINSINNQFISDKNLKVELILIIDDGKKYNKFIPKLKNNFYLRSFKTNGIKTGPGNARNLGIDKAKGKYIGFLDADDEWSDNYLEKMYKLVKLNEIAFAPTCVYENNKLIKKFEGQDAGYLKLSDIGKMPCSFHPFIKKSHQIKFKLYKSQDVYNTAYILNKHKTKIKIASEVYYKLNIRKNSVTKEEGFSHKINLAYKKYQIISQKGKHNKISREFAIRRINNLKFIEWSHSNVGGYYDYLSQKGI